MVAGCGRRFKYVFPNLMGVAGEKIDVAAGATFTESLTTLPRETRLLEEMKVMTWL